MYRQKFDEGKLIYSALHHDDHPESEPYSIEKYLFDVNGNLLVFHHKMDPSTERVEVMKYDLENRMIYRLTSTKVNTRLENFGEKWEYELI